MTELEPSTIPYSRLADTTIDWIRVVPEIATRIALGARPIESKGPTIEFEGNEITVDPGAFAMALEIAAGLPQPSARLKVTDVLNLRHQAEDMFLERLLPKKYLASVLFVPTASIAGGAYRAKMPVGAMRERDRVLAHWTETPDMAKILRFDTLWIQLQVSPLMYTMASEAKKQGVKIVFDLDDDFENVPEWNPAAKVCDREMIERYWKMIELADCVTVSTQTLALKMMGRAKRIEVLPNHIPARYWPKKVNRGDGLKRILWAGSPSHEKDLELVGDAIAQVLEENPSTRFVCFGTQTPAVLRNSKYAQQIELVRFVSFDEYPEALAAVGADVAICPLVDHPFNRSKSAIKYLEMAGCGYPVLASPVGEYAEVIKNDKTGFLVDDHDWVTMIEKGIDDKLSEIGQAGYEWVLANRDIDRGVEKWESVAITI